MSGSTQFVGRDESRGTGADDGDTHRDAPPRVESPTSFGYVAPG